MAKRWAIYAYEQMYGGLHGMCDHFCVENCNEEEVHQIAFEASMEVIQSYHDIYESLDEEIEEGITDDMTEDEIAEWSDEVYEEDVDFMYWELNELAAGYSIQQLDEMFYNNPEEFIDKYCIH